MSSTILNAGDVIGGRYEILNFIAEGGMQQVYRTRDQLLNRVVALKVPKNSSAQKRFRRSAVVSAKVNHSNVAKTLDYMEIGSTEYLVEEIIDGFDLLHIREKFLPRLDCHLAAKIFQQLSRGLAASHHVGVVHRDLKPSNIMCEGGLAFTNIKITDFGIAKMAEAEIANAVENGDEKSLNSSITAMGALPYMSPEAIESLKTAGKPADVWAIGAIMYELISGDKPFGSGYKAAKLIMDGNLPAIPPLLAGSSQFAPLGNEIYQLICRCLTKDADQRIDADTLAVECGKLCYSDQKGELGWVKRYIHNNMGFITDDSGVDVFFHIASVFGSRPSVGQRVYFCRHIGEGADRAFPVIHALQ